ncbi:semaphorin-2A-like [Antedon mediterranea]|uniref:semaphorin-2A-like n=1 Tax=Antedon mediterranea TaxID=105859 RepID=UPI003AF51007
MDSVRFIKCAILLLLIIALCHINNCEEIKITLLSSDKYDLNIVEESKASRYKLLADIDNTLFVGGKDVLKSIFIPDWNLESSEIEQNDTTFEVCEPKNDIACSRQNKEETCNNYIRVFNVMNSSRMFVCGSNALYPRCYYLDYNMTDDRFQIEKDISTFECGDTWDKRDNNGVDFTPFNWDGEMVHLFANNGSQLFSGGSRKVGQSDSVICHITFADGFPSSRICTAIGSEFLREASYVGKPIKHSGHTYFFFREVAEEYADYGKIIYSRVGRICDDDTGGTYDSLDGKLISYIKARLDCSINGGYDTFFFNELKDIYQSSEDPDMIYAVFTTPKVGLQESAVCRFDLGEIERMMNEDMFRGQDDVTDLWQPITDLAHRPGICETPIPESSYARYWKVNLISPFVKNRHEVAGTPTPMFILRNAIYTSIVVEDRLLTNMKVYILGTDNSTVYMAYENTSSGEVKMFHMIDLKETDEELDEVTDLTLRYYDNNITFVYGTTDGRIFGFQLANCPRYTQIACTSNPYCEWNDAKMRCISIFGNDTQKEDNEEKDSNYLPITTKVIGMNNTVVLKFADNSATTCLKQNDQSCVFYLEASVKNSNQGEPTWSLRPDVASVTTRSISGSFSKYFYFKINVEVADLEEEDTIFTFKFMSLNITFQVQPDTTTLEQLNVKCNGNDDKKFCEKMSDYDEKVEKYRYDLKIWPQDNAVICQSRISRQEKRGTFYFPRSEKVEA